VAVSILTYVDSGVLIYAAQGTGEMAALAIRFVTDANREYVTSDYVRIEVLPKARFHRNSAEISFYETFFAMNVRCVPTSDALMTYAFDEACKVGISGIDAIHVACAVFGGAEQLITSEKKTKPIHRTTLVKVIPLFP